MFGKEEGKITFKARIRVGGKFDQDCSYGCTWPQDAAWRLHPNPDPDTEFDAEFVPGRRYIDLRAHGFGMLGVTDGYGNGSLFVRDMKDLIMADDVGPTIVAANRAEFQKARYIAMEEVKKIDSAIAALS